MRFRSITCALFAALLVVLAPRLALAVGNAWHIPESTEGGATPMRAPLLAIGATTAVTILSGNQFQGPGGNPGNQLETGSTLFYRKAGGAWTQAPMTYASTAGNNKYFSAEIPAGAFAAGDAAEYYLRIAYSDQVTTYLYGSDGQSLATDVEAVAQAAPFRFPVEFPLDPSGSSLSLKSGAWEAHIYQASGHVTLTGPDLDAKPLASTVVLAPARAKVGGSWQAIGAVTGSTPSNGALELTQAFGAGSVKARLFFQGDGTLGYEVTDWGGALPTATAVSAPSGADEHFYGFGEKFDAFDQAGKVVHTITSDVAGPKGDKSYKVAPWFLSTRGFGFYLDSSAESAFDMRAGAADRWVVENRFSTLRWFLVHGPDLPSALSRYTALTGRPPLPPPWVFGPWISSDIWHDGGEVRYVVTRLREAKIPHSVFVFDSPWETAYNDFTWNTVQFAAGGTYEGKAYDGFASPAEMLAFLRKNGFKVVLWMTPFVDVASNDEGVPGQNLGKASIYDDAAANGYFVRTSPNGPPLLADWWKGQGSPVDFTNAAARDWLTAKLQTLVDEGGGAIGGFKTDDGEGDYIPLTASYADGRTGVEMKNGYALEYHKTIWNVLGKDGTLFARSGFAGTQAFPGCWSGDNETNYGDENGLRSVIVAGQSAAMSGYAIWGHDIGGYQDVNPSKTPEDLFMRWAQFGAFSPIMQMHRQVTAGKQYPWSFGQAGFDNYAAYARLHAKLFPYVYTYAKRASETGIPIIVPLVLDHQADPETYGVKHAYHFGDQLFVAPIVENEATERELYLPAGVWYDWWTAERVEGKKLVTWKNADRTKLPLYVREGAIVPMLRDDVQTLCDAAYVGDPTVATPTDALELAIYPADGASFEVYDGTKVVTAMEPGTTSFTLTSKPRSFLLRALHAEPLAVERDGKALAKAASPADLAATDGWAYADGFVHVAFGQTEASSTVVLRFEADAGPGSGAGAASGVGAGAGAGASSDDADSGCGCRTGTRTSGGALLAVLLGALLVASRRRAGIRTGRARSRTSRACSRPARPRSS